MLVNKVSCIAIVLSLVFAFGLTELVSRIHPNRPRDCGEVYRAGGRVEGFYAIFPDVSNPDEAVLGYCGVSEGMLGRNSSSPKAIPKNCNDLLEAGMTESGINVIYPFEEDPDSPVIVYCEQELFQGGWTVIQRRDNYEEQLDFFRGFEEYVLGFGDVSKEFWIGNNILHELTKPSISQLFIELTSFADETKFALYDSFYVGPRDRTKEHYSRQYQLAVSHFSGNAGDSLTIHNGMGFTTFDSDDDLLSGNCADRHRGAWWYNGCYSSNLNGFYFEDAINNDTSACWRTFSNSFESLKKIQMMTRPYKCQ